MGRRRKPTELLVRDGSPLAKDRLKAPRGPDAAPECPGDLSGVARAEWDVIAYKGYQQTVGLILSIVCNWGTLISGGINFYVTRKMINIMFKVG